MADPYDTPGYRYSVNEFPGDGTTINWNIQFAGRSPGYISIDHVRASVTDEDGVETPITLSQSNFIQPTLLRIEPAVPAGSVLRVWRDTPKDEPLLDYNDGALMTERNLDTSFDQAVYAAAEMVDRAADSLEDVAEFSEAVLDRLADVENTANTAQDTADTALITSNQAMSIAGQALTRADEAVDAVEGAEQAAIAATEAAQNANDAAAVATTAANQANQAAQDATDAANDAEDTAAAALAVAQGIAGTAQEALDTANGIDAKAQEALDDSAIAVQGVQDLTDDTDPAKGVSLLPFLANVPAAVARSQADVNMDFLNARTLGLTGDGTDESAKLVAAISYAVSVGRGLDLAGMSIRLNTQAKVQISEVGKRVFIRNGTILVGVLANAIQIEGTVVASGTMSKADAIPFGATTVTASAPVPASGLEGALLYMRSNANWYHDPRNGTTCKGELTRIVDVNGDSIRVIDPMHDTYFTTEDVSYWVYSSPTVTVENVTFLPVGVAIGASSGARGIGIYNCVDVMVNGLRGDGLAAGLSYVQLCHGVTQVSNSVDGANSVSGGYGHMVASCKTVVYSACQARHCRRGFDVTGGIPTRDVTYVGCTFVGGGLQSDGLPYFNPTAYAADPANPGVWNAGFSTHGGAENVLYLGCTTYNVHIPYIQRGRNVIVKDCTHYGACERFWSGAYGFGTFLIDNQVLYGHSYAGDSRSVPAAMACQEFARTRRGASNIDYDISGPIVMEGNFVEGVQNQFFYMEGTWGSKKVDIHITNNRGRVRRETNLEALFHGLATGDSTPVAGSTGMIEYHGNDFTLDDNITGRYIEVMERIQILFEGVFKTGPKRYSGRLVDNGAVSFPVDAHTKGGIDVKVRLTTNNLSARLAHSFYQGFVYEYERFAGNPLDIPYMTPVNLEVGTTPLTGATGTDGKTSISCVDQRFYIENRIGWSGRYTVEFDDGI